MLNFLMMRMPMHGMGRVTRFALRRVVFGGHQGGGAVALILVMLVIALLWRARRQNQSITTPTAAAPIDAKLANAFEELFYQVETAAAKGDVQVVQNRATKRVWRVLAAQHFTPQSLAIVDTQLVNADAAHPHVAVTFQAQGGDGMIHRYQAVWDLAYDAGGQLMVSRIH